MNNQKLLGIELCRGLAAYAVILVHSGDENWGLATDPSAISFRLNFYFGVPFFLAVAFYFLTAKPEIAYSAKFWRSRFDRIVIPYIIWTVIFLILRIIIFAASDRTDRLQELLTDPLSIVFFGGASYHLYFLALLLAGTSLILLVPLLQKLKVSNLGLLLLSILSAALYNWLEISGNSFHLGPDVAFKSLLTTWQIDLQAHPLLRLLLVEIAWLIKCLPYLCVSLLLHQIFKSKKISQQSIKIGSIGLLIAINIGGQLLLPKSFKEIILAYTLLLVGISISSYFKHPIVNNIIASVGACSFGIYLIHPLIMNIVKSLVDKISPELTNSISIPSMLALSIPCFVISWLSVAIAKNKLATDRLPGFRL
ncbi:acyltransferase [Chamaesiphon sp. VAR_48_metabat_403]|uniref:acyltransferase n=1 Tax=Chamaesiphon sp. VAR_48_metabat_403 TaxID=2964700 RepID=UPI00286DEEE7|nr:acyltransferase [Chamaesiphon sp. VAR_48_metabat_403]